MQASRSPRLATLTNLTHHHHHLRDLHNPPPSKPLDNPLPQPQRPLHLPSLPPLQIPHLQSPPDRLGIHLPPPFKPPLTRIRPLRIRRLLKPSPRRQHHDRRVLAAVELCCGGVGRSVRGLVADPEAHGGGGGECGFRLGDGADCAEGGREVGVLCVQVDGCCCAGLV